MENRGYVSKNVFLKFLEVFSPVFPAQLPQFPTSWTIAEVRPHPAPALCSPPRPQIHDLLIQQMYAPLLAI